MRTPADPLVFLSFGRPERRLAEAVTANLWDHGIECYNYLHRSVVDRVHGRMDEITFEDALRKSEFVILAMTERSLRDDAGSYRGPVVQEIGIMREMRKRGVPIVLLTAFDLMDRHPLVETELVVDINQCESPHHATERIVGFLPMGPHVRAQNDFLANKADHAAAWNDLKSKLANLDETTQLPPALQFMDRIFNFRLPGEVIAADLANIQDGINRRFVSEKIAHWLAVFDREGAKALTYENMRARFPRISDEPIGPEPGPRTSIITSVYDLMQAIRRFSNQLDAVELPEAEALARRIDMQAWPGLRTLMLCGVYRLARALGEGPLCQSIAADLAAGAL